MRRTDGLLVSLFSGIALSIAPYFVLLPGGIFGCCGGNGRFWHGFERAGSVVQWVGVALVLTSAAVLIRRKPAGPGSPTLLLRDREPAFESSASPRRRLSTGWWSVCIGALVNVVVVVLCAAPFTSEQMTEHVIWAYWDLLTDMLAAAAAVIGLPLAVCSLRLGETPWLGRCGIALSLTPLPLAIWLVNWFARIHGFDLADAS